MSNESVKVRLKFKARNGLPAGEGLWARQLDGNSGGGTYQLENSSFYVPLAVGDVVRAQLDPDGYLQVTGWVRPGPHVLTAVEVDSAQCDPDAAVSRWTASGGVWSERGGDLVLTIWDTDLPAVTRALQFDVVVGNARLLEASSPADRGRRALRDVDFRLARDPEFDYVRTDYWAPDDPYWRERGLDDADYLAMVQLLAYEDRRVTRALERGEQHRVVLYIASLTATEPHEMPQIDGPIFESE